MNIPFTLKIVWRPFFPFCRIVVRTNGWRAQSSNLAQHFVDFWRQTKEFESVMEGERGGGMRVKRDIEVCLISIDVYLNTVDKTKLRQCVVLLPSIVFPYSKLPLMMSRWNDVRDEMIFAATGNNGATKDYVEYWRTRITYFHLERIESFRIVRVGQ